MIILIDGYNLLRHIFPGVKGDMDRLRRQFIRLLGHYKYKKAYAIKEIIVVFDAGPDRRVTREIHQGIVVMFSGQQSCADDWILEYVIKHKQEHIALVSMDRALREQCKKYRVEGIDVAQFYHMVKEVLLDSVDQHLNKEHLDIQQYEQIDELWFDQVPMIDQEALDALMRAASGKVQQKDNETLVARQKGMQHQVSKKEKKIQKMLKKIQ